MATRARLTTTAKIPSQMIATLVEQPSTSSCSFVSDSSWLFLSPAHQVSEKYGVRHMECSITVAGPFFRDDALEVKLRNLKTENREQHLTVFSTLKSVFD